MKDEVDTERENPNWESERRERRQRMGSFVHGAGRAALTEVVAVLLHLLDVVLGQHGRRVPHGSPSFSNDPRLAAAAAAAAC